MVDKGNELSTSQGSSEVSKFNDPSNAVSKINKLTRERIVGIKLLSLLGTRKKEKELNPEEFQAAKLALLALFEDFPPPTKIEGRVEVNKLADNRIRPETSDTKYGTIVHTTQHHGPDDDRHWVHDLEWEMNPDFQRSRSDIALTRNKIVAMRINPNTGQQEYLIDFLGILADRYGDLSEVGTSLRKDGWENIIEVRVLDKNRSPLDIGSIFIGEKGS